MARRHGNQVTTFSVAQQHEHVEIVVHGLYEYSGSEQWLRYAEVPTLPAPFWLRNSGLTPPRCQLRSADRGSYRESRPMRGSVSLFCMKS